MSQQQLLLVDMETLGGFPAQIPELSDAYDSTRAREANYLFPASYMDSKFMNFVDNLIHQELNGRRFVLSGEDADEDDEPYFNNDDELLYYAAQMHPILSTRHAFDSSKERFERLLQPNTVRYYYTPGRNEFFDKWDMEVGANGKRIHPLLILISSCLTDYGSDLTYGDMYRFEEADNAERFGAWANEPLIALDDSLASMLFLSVKRAKRINTGYKHVVPPIEQDPATFLF